MNTSPNCDSVMTITPVGRVESEIKQPSLQAADTDLELRLHMEKVKQEREKIKENISQLVIFEPYLELLQGVDAFSHILVLYWPHLIDSKHRSLLRKVHPMGRKDMPIQGIFATCSPIRPNPVLVSAVSLLERKGDRLIVKGLEAVDGSPVLDIKPYMSAYYGVKKPQVPQWMAQLQRELDIDS